MSTLLVLALPSTYSNPPQTQVRFSWSNSLAWLLKELGASDCSLLRSGCQSNVLSPNVRFGRLAQMAFWLWFLQVTSLHAHFRYESVSSMTKETQRVEMHPKIDKHVRLDWSVLRASESILDSNLRLYHVSFLTFRPWEVLTWPIGDSDDSCQDQSVTYTR